MLSLIAYLSGALTILSPCILPVLPFVLARAGQPFLKVTLPMLAGMALTFAMVGTLAAVGGNWAAAANQYGRYAALALFAIFGATLLSTGLASVLTRPVVAFANRLLDGGGSSAAAPTIGGSLVLGIATGLLWAPCAGPILGIVLTGAALAGANVQTSLLLLAYAAGATTSLALALLIGGRVFASMKRSLGAIEWLRRGLGAAILASVVAIGFGLDQGLLAGLSSAGTARIEEALLKRLPAGKLEAISGAMASEARVDLPVEGRLPSLDGAVTWLNSAPLSAEQLRGKVVLVTFWTYSCINCIRTFPYVRAWAEKYRDQGLVVIGVHTPEFAFEKKPENVRKAVAHFGIGFPVAVDSDYAIWRAFRNNYWPARYIVDARGQVRYHHLGEGDYEKTGKVIEQLLGDMGQTQVGVDTVASHAAGAEVAPDLGNLRSSETYIGYSQASNFASPERLKPEAPQDYTAARIGLNHWGLSGTWTIGSERASLDKAEGGITHRFSARDLHLVLGPDAQGRPVRFQVTLDGKPPGEDHGADIDAEGNGTVTDTRLYQLVRQAGTVRERLFEIRFLDPGVEAYAFTFG